MRAVVPAAGEGTRLRPLADDRPKPLVEVAGVPLLVRVLDALVPLGVSEFVVVVGHRGDQVVERVGASHRGVPVRYVRQPEPLGLADAVLRAEDAVDGSFLVVNGDNAIDADLSSVVEAHRERSPAATVPLARVSPAEARETGVATVEDGRVTAAVEKADEPPSTLAMTGFYVFEPVVFDACRRIEPSPRGELELADALDRLVRDGRRVEAVPFPGWRTNVNTPADVEIAARRLG